MMVIDKSQEITMSLEFMKSQKLYQEGIELLFKSQQSNFEDKVSLEKANDLFYQAIDMDIKNPYPYVGIAFIFTLLGQELKAQAYLQEAQRFSLNEEIVQEFNSALAKMKQMSERDLRLNSFQAMRLISQPQTTESFEHLYDQVEDFISFQMQELLKVNITFDVTIDANKFSKQKELYQDVLLFESVCAEKISVIEREFDTNELEVRLKPIRILKSRLKIAIQFSEQFDQLLTRMKILQQDIKDMTSSLMNLRSQPDEFELAMEPLYNACDEIADELDSLSQKVLIRPLEKVYEILVNKVSILQESIDN